MEDCKTKINEESKSKVQKRQSSRYRTLLRKMVYSCPEVTIIDDDNEDGDVIFSVSMEDMGLTMADYIKYKPEIFSNYIVDSIAELLVRENLDAFSQILTKMDTESYTTLIGKFEHRRFGMKIIKSHFVFRFHISLLQTLLTEDIKNKVK
jgi:hypothetical protein